MTREEAIKMLNKWGVLLPSEASEAVDMAIEALQREEAEEKGYCHRIKPKEYLSADAVPTVIRSKTLMPTKDFKVWAKRIREENPNAVIIPCDAEVVSADSVVRCKDCKHRPHLENKDGAEYGFNVVDDDGASFGVCPCLCEDGWYSWMPKDDFFCARAERREP